MHVRGGVKAAAPYVTYLWFCGRWFCGRVRPGQDSVRYIRSTSCVLNPSRSYTVTAAVLSAST